MPERRSYKRVTIEGMDVHCRVPFATEVKFLNVSPIGVSISLNRRLNIGCKYTLHIERKDNPISLKGVVVWEKIADLQRKTHQEIVPIYEVGIRFGDVSTDDAGQILDSIERDIIAQELMARLSRLSIEVTEPMKGIVIGPHKNYYVMRIDMNGMFMETEQSLDVEDKVRAEMSLPDSDSPVKFTGRVVFCSDIPGKNPKRYDMAIEFIEMSKEDKIRLEEFIMSL